MHTTLLRTVVLASGLAMAGAASANMPNLIVNGSFESIAQGDNSWSIYGNGQLDGWKVGKYGVEVRDSVAGEAFDGENFVELDTTRNSWISQSFATVIGQTYTVSYAYAPRNGVSKNSNALGAFIDGVRLDRQAAAGVSPDAWDIYSFDFVAGKASTTLKFAALGKSDSYGGSLDAVAVTAAPVPEPETWAMLLAGVAFVGSMARRRIR